MAEVEKSSVQEVYTFDPSISSEEREFYLKAYPKPEYVCEYNRRTHCTTCKVHIGTAPCNVETIKMHPILRVTHCTKCHDFYNSGEFSKGEDGSELYCRWCGQGGEVYCCSNCPFVFCKSCITKNLSRGVVADIEQNENWRCFGCAPKILWPLRAMHWALINYINKQIREIENSSLPEDVKQLEMARDRSNCCRLAKAKCGNMSDSMESIDSLTSKRSHTSNNSSTQRKKIAPAQSPLAKRAKTSNDEVVCTPDLLSMLEPDCEITVQGKNNGRAGPPPVSTTPRIFTVQQNYGSSPSAPPPLVLRNTGIQVRPVASTPVLRRTVVSPRAPTPTGSNSPVYHTINGFRIDLNSAAQQGTYRLPNGKLIQVKRQSATGNPNAQSPHSSQNPPTPNSNWQQSQSQPQIQSQSTSQRVIAPRNVQITPMVQQQRQIVTIQSQSSQAATTSGLQQHSTPVRYPGGIIGNTIISPFSQNGPQIQMINGANVGPQQGQQQTHVGQAVTVRPVMMRNIFSDSPIGNARTQLQDQVFSAMDICQHLTGKVQTLTNSNAYKQARSYLEVKELYIHLSYLLTYAIGRFKGLQDKCLNDMRQLGFVNDADSLENGQLAAGVDYVRYGQLEDAEMFTSGLNSFHNQIYEYRKSLNENLEDDNLREPLSPLFMLRSAMGDEAEERNEIQRDHQPLTILPDEDDYDDSDVREVEPSEKFDDTYADEDPQDDGGYENVDDDCYSSNPGGTQKGTEDVMLREEESHAYDRKLTRLIQQYPSIWCTRHPDYGNFEVTRKQWRTIASHFKRSTEMKMRWKNIRKRYVRIERRIQEGKRFNGYFDKATNFLVNRDTPMSDWVSVDCGITDGDMYERENLDAIEKAIHQNTEKEKKISCNDFDNPPIDSPETVEILPLDLKIIHFVKCNPVLWRKSTDPTFNKMDEQTRKSLWLHLWKSVPKVRCSELIDRWAQMYEMYKAFRLKTIKSEYALAALELKYSKYLAKLYFLYKVDEDELLSECDSTIFGDEISDEEFEDDEEPKVLDLPDDREFIQHLMRALRDYPQIWNKNHVEYYDIMSREDAWKDIERRLQVFQRDVHALKKRWILAKFCYDRLRRERRTMVQDSVLHRHCMNLPTEEMTFLNFY